MLTKLNETLTYLKSKTNLQPEIGMVLGTGLGKIIEHIQIDVRLDYTDIPHFPVSTVESHKGHLIFGTLEGKSIVAIQGRFHSYNFV